MAEDFHQVVVVGGGAAGIAATRRLVEANIDVLLLEARDRLGGRAMTIRAADGFPIDLGCGWLHSADQNPWAAIANEQRFEIDRTAPPWMSGIPPQDGFDSGATGFGPELMRVRSAMDDFTEDQPDRAASELLPPGGKWNGLIDAVSTYYSGVELDRLSLLDYARFEDSGVNWRLPAGYGTMIAAYGAPLPVRLNVIVRRIDRRGTSLRVILDNGSFAAETVIVTLPSDVIAQTEDLFLPPLPGKAEAAAGVPLGLADKLFLSLPDAEAFNKDSRAFGRTDRRATAAYHFRPFGRPQIEAYFGGELAAELEKGGIDAFLDFARKEIAGLFGSNVGRSVGPLAVHSWRADPLARGSYSYALPGRAGARGQLAEPVEDRIFFAGEACSRNDFSTAHGAYRTGIAAADEVIDRLASRRRR